ncbi:hypothetical protein [Aeromonas sp. 600724]|uniref:hypothetical protein n=1 Tax=Aeromonas sp. 600724 TaxID=2712031 RepID=UPI003B9FFF3D
MSSRNSPVIDKAPGSRCLSFYRRLALLFALLATSSSALALSLHDLDPAFERCEALKSQHGATLPAQSDPFWSLEREQQATVLIYLHEKSMERCTSAEVDALAIKAFHRAVEGDSTFLNTLIKARTTTLTPAQQAQLQKIGQAELDRLVGMKEFALPFSLSNYLKQL